MGLSDVFWDEVSYVGGLGVVWVVVGLCKDMWWWDK